MGINVKMRGQAKINFSYESDGDSKDLVYDLDSVEFEEHIKKSLVEMLISGGLDAAEVDEFSIDVEVDELRE